jgi:hypothetical protein
MTLSFLQPCTLQVRPLLAQVHAIKVDEIHNLTSQKVTVCSINTRCIQNQIENENKQRILKDLPEKVMVHFKHNFYAI